jgi:hypothetical protein
MRGVAKVDMDKVTTAVIHDGDEEAVYICSDSETAWRKVGNQMIMWLPSMRAAWGPDEDALLALKDHIEKHEYAEAAELWDQITNGEQHFEVDMAEVVMSETEPVWPATLEI